MTHTVTNSEEKNEILKKMKFEISNYLKTNNLTQYGGKKIVMKSIFFISLTVGCYFLIIQSTNSSKVVLELLYGLLGLCFAGIGFNIMHDASHKTFSKNKRYNQLMLYSLDLMGANSALWFIKHVVIHHNHTNSPDDDDMNSWPIIRLHSDEKKLWFHKYQYIYAPIAYSFLYLFWVYVNDPIKYFTGKIKNHKIKKHEFKNKDHVTFWLSKIIHPILFIVIPAFYIGTINAIIGYITMAVVCGIAISFVFQLAHIVEETDEIKNDATQQSYSHMENQIRTTSNFATKNKLITFLFGGLNYQIEHHLFPYISHIHYPKINKIVQAYLKEAGIKYNESTFFEAIGSHFRALKKLGAT